MHQRCHRLPGAAGLDHLFNAGLWVGARVGGEVRVTTCSGPFEVMPTEDPGDSVQVAFTGIDGGNRFPWPDPDDDGDDRAGRSQASGVYLVRLATKRGVVQQRVTLVR